jgi:hypothetical protein
MGPFETKHEASRLPAVQAIYAAFRADPGVGRMAPHSLRMLDEACAAARVDLGAFDRRVLAWLSEWEPETAAVVAGLIARAYDAGRAAAEARGTTTVAAFDRVAAVLAAFDWEHDDRQLALEAIERIVLAGDDGGPR